MPTQTPNALLRLRKHADYQRVYTSSRKQFSKQMTFFFSLRPSERRSNTPGPRIGLTVGKVLGIAVERNRIKRRLRECIRRHAPTLTFPVDVILHPRRTALTLDASTLDREIAQIFRLIQTALTKQSQSTLIQPAQRSITQSAQTTPHQPAAATSAPSKP